MTMSNSSTDKVYICPTQLLMQRYQRQHFDLTLISLNVNLNFFLLLALSEAGERWAFRWSFQKNWFILLKVGLKSLSSGIQIQLKKSFSIPCIFSIRATLSSILSKVYHITLVNKRCILPPNEYTAAQLKEQLIQHKGQHIDLVQASWKKSKALNSFEKEKSFKHCKIRTSLTEIALHRNESFSIKDVY
uniref:Uncharacterized protein n=1 Tax=Glossina pallidipes TaxID=7398 RepID=A0A1B0A9N8_GLOPL